MGNSDKNLYFYIESDFNQVYIEVISRKLNGVINQFGLKSSNMLDRVIAVKNLIREYHPSQIKIHRSSGEVFKNTLVEILNDSYANGVIDTDFDGQNYILYLA